MVRGTAALCAVAAIACADNPYVIGKRNADAAAPPAERIGECAGELAQALACSDFESEELEADWDAITTVNGATIQRSVERAFGGAGSLHATSSQAESVAIVIKQFPPLDAGEVFLRAYLFVPSGLDTEIMNIFFLGSLAEPEPYFPGVDFNIEDGALQIYSPDSDPARTTSDDQIPRDRWFCLRAHVVVADGAGLVELFVDDALVLAATDLDTLPPEGLGVLRAGIDWSSEQATPFEVFFDDIALSTTPVACR